eukprot:CAMPEP_0203662450 /NCGR_PEP_ID=MMETSP0090-20130426/409_1 /ASSEMBLY_ACC=CAM_ASM_001088 /TAXON_ID=426623 /ORGANISM="Chaetoceros affinis, Strain CCMP159" /LENGTH=814 /DNA_ID=CAMNT_0050525237 /DNA_START=7 /DNA_END=2451 /DNA_ORIENTATION=+
MPSKWHEKQEKKRLEQALRDEAAVRDAIDFEGNLAKDVRGAAMGEGEEELFEKKLSKEEKKALAKAKREAKKKAKGKGGKDGGTNGDGGDDDKKGADLAKEVLKNAQDGLFAEKDFSVTNEAADKLATEGTICTFSTSKKGVDERSRDINVSNFTLQHKGMVMLDGTDIILNHGNRYGLLGRNGCGKSTLMKALGARAVPIPSGIDIFHLKEEIEPSDTISAIDAVMSVDEERERLEKEAENLNNALSSMTDDPGSNDNGDDEEELTLEEQQEQLMDLLNYVYERLDALDASTAETRARSILKGLGFTHEMQEKKTKEFSGGWRMRVSLARALFIQPTLLLLDEPTNHLDMEAVIWLEDYLSKWDKILLLISHSQDFLNNVTTHTIHFTNRKVLTYYDGNYDQFIKTKSEKDENQMKRYQWEQDQIKSMKEYIARFGHGTSKNAKQAQSKEKVLEKMVRAGLTPMPEQEKPLNFKFPDPGHLPPPVLAFHDVTFGYPGCQPLYDNVNFGVDLDSRVALVGPNGAGKTTLVKLMSGELQPSLGDIRPHGHLKMGRFTQHFVDVLDLDLTPLEFFEREYPNDPREEQRKYLGRFGVSGKMQVQKMEELSDGQKSRVVFAKLGRDVPHILLLDEPTNHLDMESIDALAKAVNEFDGGLVLVSHDMRLISQVAKEIWICDNKTVAKYHGDIQNFKMDMRNQMGIEGEQKGQLRGDASVSVKKASEAKQNSNQPTKTEKKVVPKEKTVEKVRAAKPERTSQPEGDVWDNDDDNNKGITEKKAGSSLTSLASMSSSLPSTAASSGLAPRKYIPPHLRNRS